MFSPAVRHTLIRILLVMSTHLDLSLEQMDVTNVFLHGKLEKNILMEQPRGFEVKRKKE